MIHNKAFTKIRNVPNEKKMLIQNKVNKNVLNKQNIKQNTSEEDMNCGIVIGDSVWLRVLPNTNKSDPKWHGPYKVIKKGRTQNTVTL